jgi:hypothetical protein
MFNTLGAAPPSVPGYRDDLGPGGATTPTRNNARIGTKRRETLLSLLDALNQLTEDPDVSQGKRLLSFFGMSYNVQ